MTDFRLESIGQIHVSVADLDRSVAFYHEVLGMPLLFRVPGQPMAFLDCGGIRLYLGKPENKSFESRPLIYYRVESIRAAYDALRSRGVTFESEPHVVHRDEHHELWMVNFRDPDDNAVVLMSEVPHARRRESDHGSSEATS